MGKKASFSIDWEPWFAGTHPYREWNSLSQDIDIHEPTYYLLNVLEKRNVKAVWYCLGWLRQRYEPLFNYIKSKGHIIGDHTYWHQRNESQSYLGIPFRSPYWSETPMPNPPSGGFFFRAMPYPYVKWACEKSGQFWIHPHDIMLKHPKLNNPILNMKRHIGLKNSRKKLERLLQDISCQ